MQNNALCASCFADGRQNRYSESKVNGAVEPASSNSKGLKSYIGWFVLPILMLTIFFSPRKSIVLPSINLTSASSSNIGSDPCEAKRRCLVAYVTPWCPACHGSVGFINQVATRVSSRDDVGFKVIVGGDSAQRCSQFARKFSGATFLDPDSHYQRAAGFSGVPHWLVLDEKRKIVSEFSGSYGGAVSSEQLPTALRKMLGSEVQNLL